MLRQRLRLLPARCRAQEAEETEYPVPSVGKGVGSGDESKDGDGVADEFHAAVSFLVVILIRIGCRVFGQVAKWLVFSGGRMNFLNRMSMWVFPHLAHRTTVCSSGFIPRAW